MCSCTVCVCVLHDFMVVCRIGWGVKEVAILPTQSLVYVSGQCTITQIIAYLSDTANHAVIAPCPENLICFDWPCCPVF